MTVSKYSTELPRVSSIVEFIYPFAGEAKSRFIEWLASLRISLVDYMKEASTGGTFVHSKLEGYLSGKKYSGKKYKGFIQSGIQFIEDYKIVPKGMEVYIRNKDYQGTIDLIAEIDGEDWVLDWKTYGLAKKKFGVASTYRKPYDKLKKASLQLSLYAYDRKIDNIGVIELTEDGYHFHKLVKWSDKELKKVIKEFQYHYVDQI